MKHHSQQAASRFDDWADSYSEGRISSWFRFYQSMAMSQLKIAEGCGFLDVGCGTGWAVRQAAKQLQVGKACGIDISAKMIENAVAETSEAHNIEFQIGDAEAIPYPDESFSSIICTFSIHHYQNPVSALSEMKRVLKPDGSIVILDSARDVSFAIWLQDRGRRYFEKSHVKYYTTKEMTDLIAKAQLQLIGDITTINKFMDHNKVFTGLMLLSCTK
ncbi:MAG: class I SAM-dependent methyltransferase [Coleofasciculus sp. D1-CHI-01]|uniref:class I SAM-dependent methyltransferase n=1 Tax=Coleofasciculus sp. D1-CHI-01 TaxID=3068482 RepID=UPI0032FAFF0A